MHPGLILDKPGKADWWTRDDAQYVRNRLTAVCESPGDPPLLGSLHERRRVSLSRAVLFEATTTAPFSLHLARANGFENAGICLHPLYGFAYLPGSGLKGMARAFATLSGESKELIDEVFGPASDGKSEASSGSVVFNDAWPTCWPRLTVDIVNCHHRYYYEDRGVKYPPEDWEDPVPVTFLAVPAGTQFEFCIAPRVPGNERHKELCNAAVSWLQSALVHLGAGAKTNAGYGRFLVKGINPPGLPETEHFEAKLTLVTPAFLAGALQRPEDCDLRAATLRGLLRWWWRSLHAGSLPLQELRRLEGFLWGTTESSGAIAVEVTPDSANPRPFAFSVDEIRDRNKIQHPQGKKEAQGFFYLAYGMQEVRKKDGFLLKPARPYLPPGSTWCVRMTARARKDPGSNYRWSPQQLLQQASAALFALVHCGGVGAKVRRGYGSLSIIPISGVQVPTEVAGILKVAALASAPQNLQPYAPSLTRLAGNGVSEFQLPGREPWFALDQLGAAYQQVASDYRHQRAKLALGLPRKINDPRGNDFLVHPHPNTVPEGQKKLGKPANFRHASPLHFKLLERDGNYFVRVTAFADPYLPHVDESERFLLDVLGRLERALNSRAGIQAPPPPRPPTQVAAAPTPKAAASKPPLSTKQVTKGKLLDQSKKGTWRVEEVTTGLKGPIQNSKEMPGTMKEGDVVQLRVKIATPIEKVAFDWIKEG